MHPIHDLIRKARKRGGAVEGAAAKTRMDRKPGKRASGGPAEPFEREPRAAGGSLRSKFNAAVNDQPARPTIRESGPVPAVHNRELGIDEPHKPLEPNKGWVDGQPRKRGGRAHGGYAGDDDGQPAKRGGRAKGFHPGGEKGKLHREIGVPVGEKIPSEKLAEAKRSRNPEIRRDAIRAETMKKWKH